MLAVAGMGIVLFFSEYYSTKLLLSGLSHPLHGMRITCYKRGWKKDPFYS